MTQTIKTGSATTVTLPAGKRLTVTAGGGNAIVIRSYNNVEVESTSLSSTQEALYGAYFVDMVFRINALAAPVTYAITQSTEPVRSGIAAITGGTINNVAMTGSSATGTTNFSLTENIRMFPVEGAPVDAVQAALTVNPAGDENAITYTAVAYGAVGNDISVEYVDPEENDAEIAVSVTGSAITVSLATGEEGAITSTAAQVKTAIEANAAAAALVTLAFATDGGAGDGSGVVTAMASADLEDGAGTGIATAGKGSIVVDYDNGKLYINGGTLAVPVWKLVTSAD